MANETTSSKAPGASQAPEVPGARSLPYRAARGRGTKRRRVRSRHPGVVLIRPERNGKHPHWRARFVDPDRRKVVKVRIELAAQRTEETRRDWAVRKSEQLAQRRLALELGAPRATGAALENTINAYFHSSRGLRPRTKEDYRVVANKFIAWSAVQGIRTADEIDRAALLRFRDFIMSEPKRAPATGRGQRGRRKDMGETRSAQTVNSELRRLRTVLAYLCDLDLFARLSNDDLRRSLKRMTTHRKRVEYLAPTDLQRLLEAAMRHDTDTFAATRLEHAGHGVPGTTLRYDAIAPFVAFVTLSGMRFGEALNLGWDQVDLSAKDWDGQQTGEIHLEGGSTKTHKPRTVRLEVSPALRRMLAALRLRDGGSGRVFDLTATEAQAAAKRLKSDYGAPPRFGWQVLRRSCGTFLTNAPGIFRGASASRSAQQLGHSVAIAERHYVGLVRGIGHDARTLEDAMEIAALVATITAEISSRTRNASAVRG